MKTIQEHLRECNREEIINSYIYDNLFSVDLLNQRYEETTIGELKESMRYQLNRLIDRLVEIKPEETDDPGILMVVHAYDWNCGSDDIATILVYRSEAENGFVTLHDHAYFLETHEVMAGYYVADTYLTKYYFNDLIKSFLMEAMVLGPEQEGRPAMIKKLEKADEDIKAGRTYSSEEVRQKLFEEFGVEEEIKDPIQDEAEEKLLKEKMEYNYLCREIEIEKLKEHI